MTQEVPVEMLAVGDHVWFVLAEWVVRATERVAANTIRLHLARMRVGFIEAEVWRPVFCPGSTMQRVVK